MSKQKKNGQGQNEINFTNYIVAFIDILGQGEALDKWGPIPSNEQEKSKFIKVLKESLGVYLGINNYVDAFFTSEDVFKYFVAELMIKDKKKYLENQIKRQRFSDGFVLYTSLDKDLGTQAIINAHNMVLVCSALMLTTLAAGHPIRGGIALSSACDIRPNELYGPAIAKSYELENSIAQYPRIVVDDSVHEYFTDNKNLQGDNFAVKQSQRIATNALTFLTEDHDGYLIIDFLGENLKKLIAIHENLDENKICNKVFDFAAQQLQQHRANKNTKLTMRYLWLQKYINSRLTNKKV